jgi:hypothetical protein
MENFSDFSNDLVGFQLTNRRGTNLMTLNNFSIQTNLEPREFKDFSNRTGSFSKGFTLDDMNSSCIEDAEKLIKNNTEIFLNLDKSNIEGYAYFGSIKEKLRYAVENIIVNWPGSLYIVDEVEGVNKLNIIDYSYNESIDETHFKIPVICIENKFNLNYVRNKSSISSSEAFELKNIPTRFLDYVVYINETEYEILDLIPAEDIDSGYLEIKCVGQPFTGVPSGFTVHSELYHIKPKSCYLDNFINGLDELEYYLLSRDVTPIYTAKFKLPSQLEDGSFILTDELFTWPVTDGYNIDIDTFNFRNYFLLLTELGLEYDKYKKDLIVRFLTPPGLIEYDTPDRKMYALLQMYGWQFDKRKIYIDSLTHVNKLSYDKKENMSDVLIKNFAKNLGFGVVSSISEADLLSTFIKPSGSNQFSGTSVSYTPAEVDIELWRRIAINSSYLFKSKGTRKPLQFLFELIGAPDCLVEFEEHVYTAKKLPLNTVNSLYANTVDTSNIPSDTEGYPKYLTQTDDYYFQMKGGWYETVDVLDEIKNPIGYHDGQYDNGQSYFQPFRNVGFELLKQVDNKKSWVKTVSAETRTDIETFTYNVEDERLIMNTKEVSMTMDIAKAIECDVYNFNKINDFPVFSGITSPYPVSKWTNFQTQNLSFREYMDKVYAGFIDARTRKIVSDAHGGGYPTLKKIYHDYYRNVQSNKLDYEKILKYVELIDTYWVDLVAQFIPATTIFLGSGKKLRNTMFDRQKFVYKRGINDGSEFITSSSTQSFEFNSNRIEITASKAKEYKNRNNLYKVNLDYGNLYLSTEYCFTDSNKNTIITNKGLFDISNWTDMIKLTTNAVCNLPEEVVTGCLNGYVVDGYVECGYVS